MNKKLARKKSYYTDSLTNVLILLVLIFVLLITALAIFLLFRYLLISVFNIEKNISEMISIVVSIVLFIIPSLHKLKNFLYRTKAILQQLHYRLFRKNFIPAHYEKSDSQNYVISKAICMLQSTGGKIISVEGEAGNGKTMTSVFLVDDIGKNKDLLNLFIEFEKSILYLDAGQEFYLIKNLFTDIETEPYSLVFIDNLQKLSVDKITTVLGKVKSVSEYANESGKTSLVMLMYQNNYANNHINKSLNDLLSNQIINNTILFTLKDFQDLNDNNYESDKELFDRILACNDHLSAHLIRMYKNNRNNKLLMWTMDLLDNSICVKSDTDKRRLFFSSAIIMLSRCTGFVNKNALLKILLSETSFFSKFQAHYYIEMFSKSGFLQPFPLKKDSFIFNEILSDEYRKALASNKLFCEYCNKCAFIIFSDNTICNSEFKWLYLISCNTSDFENVSSKVSEKLFYSCMESFNIDYILSCLETELKIEPIKKSLLQVELGILCIRAGKWKQAREIIKPYIYKSQVSKKIWELQLQIIEADHGVNDEENYTIINRIISASNDSYIVFQAKYWLAHIKMEQGDFSLEVWEDLQTMVKENTIWNEENTYSHFIHRIAADTCRTYFLKGEHNPLLFENTIEFFKSQRKRTINQEDLALLDLEEAHYIHYELLYQLGIWNRYIFEHNKQLSKNDQLSFDELIETALKKYNLSIARFQQSGVKTWRTAKIRRDELSLALATPNFIEIFGDFDDFEQYAIENHIDVFIGYIKCLQGKALALCAYKNYINATDSTYESYLESALNKLKESSETYKEYGNTYGKLRSELLHILIDTTVKISSNRNSELQSIINESLEAIKKLGDEFNEENLREKQIINYLTSLKSLKFQDFVKIITYYPIVLQ